MGGEIASGFSTIANYGFQHFATQLFDNELASFASDFAKEIASNWITSVTRGVAELYPDIFMRILN